MVINRKTGTHTSTEGMLPRSLRVNLKAKSPFTNSLSAGSNLYRSGVTSGTLSELHVREIERIPDKVSRIDAYRALLDRVRIVQRPLKKRVVDLIRLASMYIEGLPEEVGDVQQAINKAHSCLLKAINFGDDALGTANYIDGKLLFELAIDDTTEKGTNLMKSAERCFLFQPVKNIPER